MGCFGTGIHCGQQFAGVSFLHIPAHTNYPCLLNDAHLTALGLLSHGFDLHVPPGLHFFGKCVLDLLPISIDVFAIELFDCCTYSVY